MSDCSSSVTIHNVCRLIVGYIENAFQQGSWKHGVKVNIEKTKPGWFSTQIAMRITWTGDKPNVDAFTKAAKAYLASVDVL